MRAFNTVARQVARELGQQRIAAWLEHDLGIPYAEKNALDGSLRHFRAGLEMFRAIGDLPGQARCCSSLSHVLELLGRLDEAVELAEEALELSQQIGDHTLEGISYLALGALYLPRGETIRADRAFNRAIALATIAGSERSLAKRHQVAAESYAKAGFAQLGIDFMTKALATFQRMSDVHGQAESHRFLASVSLAMGDFAKARHHAESSAELARASGNNQREGGALIELGKVEQAIGHLTAAREHWRAAATLLHSQSAHHEAVALTLLAQTE
jgi:tetratricopeptide (TPR) repeat protein